MILKFRYLIMIFLFVVPSFLFAQELVLNNVNFFGSGARAMGIGGAFVSLADDATATEWNPAGLMILETPEISFQYKYTYDLHKEKIEVPGESSQPYDSPNKYLDLYKEKVFTDSYLTPSFVSFIYPFQRFVIALTYLSTINWGHTSYQEANGSYYWPRDDQGIIWGFNVPQRYQEETMRFHQFGISFACNLIEDLSVGVTGKFALLNYEKSLEKSEPSSYRKYEYTAEDKTFGFNIGLLYKFNDNIKVGLNYRSNLKFNPNFKITSTYTKTYLQWYDPVENSEIKSEYNFPYIISSGISYRPLQKIMVALDANYINWCQLKSVAEDFKRDNGLQIRGGIEYLLFEQSKKRLPVPLRIGYYNDPPNDSFYMGDDLLKKAKYVKEKTIHHVTFGIGFNFSHLQVDIAGDVSKNTKEIMSSIVYRL